jgi:hypothetical protein
LKVCSQYAATIVNLITAKLARIEPAHNVCAMNSEELKREQLFSNLLEVAYPETLYSVGTNCKDAKTVWTILNNAQEDPPSDWIYKARTLYAFHDFSDRIWRMFARKTS